MIKDKRQVILEAVKAAKKSGFKATAIKVELEANLDRDWSLEDCHDYMMRRLEGLGLAICDENEEDYLSHEEYTTPWQPKLPLTYAEFYNDGSVDSEFTFTLMLDNPENIFLLPQIVRAFNDLAERASDSGEMDIRGAGMHMAFLNSLDGIYPTRTAMTNGWANFAKSMRLLLPALYFLGASCNESRGLAYRRPDIGFNSHRAAVDYRGGALEFRVFDTCYSSPDTILDNFVVMSKCLRYWRNKYLPSGVEKIATRTRFGKDDGNTLERFYVSYEHLELLNHGLARLKPNYYTIRELKKQRDFEVSKRKLDRVKKERIKAAEAEYSEYEERFDWSLLMYKGEYIKDKAVMMRLGSQQYSPNRVMEIEAEAVQNMEQRKQTKKSVKQYVREILTEFEQSNRGDFLLEI